MVRPALAVSLLALLAPAPAGAALETILQDDALLIHRPTGQVDAALARIRALGVDRVRLTANWSALAPDPDAAARPAGFRARDPAAYEQARWRGLDQAVGLARAHGLRVLVDIGFWAPRWATDGTPGPRARSRVRARDYAAFAVAVARRYSGRFVPPVQTAPPSEPGRDETLLEALLGGRGPVAEPPPPPPAQPLDRVDQFALWNEPNHPGLLLPQWRTGARRPAPASPAIYRRMLLAAYPVAKAARPDARFLVGNTASIGAIPAGQGAMAPLRFLRELACVNRALEPRRGGACRDFARIPGDGWAHHPYNRNGRPDARSPAFARDDAMLGDLPRLSLLLRRLVARGRLAPALRRIHIDEFGYETARVGHRPEVTLAQQARWLTWAEHRASRVRGVVSFAQFLLRDQPPAPVRVSDSDSRPYGQYSTGLDTADGRPKPAARAFRAGLFAARRPGGRVLLWARLRLGGGERLMRVQRRTGRGPWRTLLRFRAAGSSATTRVVRGRRGARYRLAWAGGTGLPVGAVRDR